MATITTEREVLTEFLKIYKTLRCLWDNSHREYSNKNSRSQALNVLLEQYKKVDSNATILSVKKKIEHLRSGYQRENRKVVESIGTEETVYTPSLWYYKHLTFLDDRNATDTDKSKGKTSKIKMASLCLKDTDELLCNSSSNRKRKRKSLAGKGRNLEEELIEFACNRLKQRETEYEKIASTWAVELEKLSEEQQIHAKKAINDILYEGQLGNLFKNCVQVIPKGKNPTPSDAESCGEDNKYFMNSL